MHKGKENKTKTIEKGARLHSARRPRSSNEDTRTYKIQLLSYSDIDRQLSECATNNKMRPADAHTCTYNDLMTNTGNKDQKTEQNKTRQNRRTDRQSERKSKRTGRPKNKKAE
mmetsp:Transcript_45800/g.90203  ORF Transcript_45800/g.90203 Transcript_45800/m.90203 type:complete len:113 (+) Transcript_45800:3023-3361(+)